MSILDQSPAMLRSRSERMAYLDALAREQGIEHSKENKTRVNKDQKRCPFCRGEQGQYEGKGNCWLTACSRGPNGRQCGCHYVLSGMGSRGQEGWLDKKPDISPVWRQARAAQTITCDVRQIP